MIKVHAFYSFKSLHSVAFVFQHTDGTCYTFNGACWEDGKPMIRKASKVNFDIMGMKFNHRTDSSYPVSLLTIKMDGHREIGMPVDEYQTFDAYGKYYLGVVSWSLTDEACAFGSHCALVGWATRGIDHRRQHSVNNVFFRLEKTGVHVGHERDFSDTPYVEEFDWILDYGTGNLIEGVGTKNQLVKSS